MSQGTNFTCGEMVKYRSTCIIRARTASQDQIGFRKGKSTVGAINKVLGSVRPTPKYPMCRLSLKKNAFNNACWSKVTARMTEIGMTEYLINFIDFI